MILYLLADGLDFEVLLIVMTAIAGVWAMVSEARSHRKDADERVQLHARMGSIEIAVASIDTIQEQLADARERLAAVESRFGADLRERVVTLEAAVASFGWAERLAVAESRIAGLIVEASEASENGGEE